MKIILFLLCVTVLSSVTNQRPINFIDLALKKCKNDKVWTIHGFWAEYTKHTYPQWCNKSRYSQFSLNKLHDLLPIMERVWHSCPEWNGTNNTQLWHHEWDKHGTCLREDSVVDYFNHTISAYLSARNSQWFNCCQSHKTQCLIPFSNGTWIGWCY